MSPPYTYLDLVNQVDSFPHAILHPIRHAERLTALKLFTSGSHTLGYIHDPIFEVLKTTAAHERSEKGYDHWVITANTVSIKGDTVEERSSNIKKTLEHWREMKTFEVCSGKGWRNELYPVYCPNGELFLEMERSAACLFGVVQYGVHMTVYVPGATTEDMRIWTPTRHATKSTYPGMLDNTVAGGISSGMTAWDTLVKEGHEEAYLEEDVIKEKAKCVGTVSYFYERDANAGGESGLLQPEVQYVYDMAVGENEIVPKPNDMEVDNFVLMPLAEVKKNLEQGRFKPNCALVLIDFFVRHNIITPENEADYIEICSRLHRALEFPLCRSPAAKKHMHAHHI
ncbi:NUDIX hydrolase domain-like protein [Pyronema omphalodes]|nr:NUDIX hydrolase domain-like protein [Pyronema omphalodes]